MSIEPTPLTLVLFCAGWGLMMFALWLGVRKK